VWRRGLGADTTIKAGNISHADVFTKAFKFPHAQKWLHGLKYDLPC
jgi:hypothetical protein